MTRNTSDEIKADLDNMNKFLALIKDSMNDMDKSVILNNNEINDAMSKFTKLSDSNKIIKESIINNINKVVNLTSGIDNIKESAESNTKNGEKLHELISELIRLESEKPMIFNHLLSYIYQLEYIYK
jgi:predicted  nucleic acid-binding Zn-ribbon protein